MILYNNIVKISKNRWIGYMLKVAFLLASSIFQIHLSWALICLENYFKMRRGNSCGYKHIFRPVANKSCLCMFLLFETNRVKHDKRYFPKEMRNII